MADASDGCAREGDDEDEEDAETEEGAMVSDVASCGLVLCSELLHSAAPKAGNELLQSLAKPDGQAFLEKVALPFVSQQLVAAEHALAASTTQQEPHTSSSTAATVQAFASAAATVPRRHIAGLEAAVDVCATVCLHCRPLRVPLRDPTLISRLAELGRACGSIGLVTGALRVAINTDALARRSGTPHSSSSSVSGGGSDRDVFLSLISPSKQLTTDNSASTAQERDRQDEEEEEADDGDAERRGRVRSRSERLRIAHAAAEPPRSARGGPPSQHFGQHHNDDDEDEEEGGGGSSALRASGSASDPLLRRLRDVVLSLGNGAAWESLSASLTSADPLRPTFSGCSTFAALGFAHTAVQRDVERMTADTLFQTSPDASNASPAGFDAPEASHDAATTATTSSSSSSSTSVEANAQPVSATVAEDNDDDGAVAPSSSLRPSPPATHSSEATSSADAQPASRDTLTSTARAPHHLAPLQQTASASGPGGGGLGFVPHRTTLGAMVASASAPAGTSGAAARLLLRPPREVLDPFSGQAMLEPVETPSGFVCDRASLAEWCLSRGGETLAGGDVRGPDPLTGAAMRVGECRVRADLQAKAEAWLKRVRG